MTDQNEYRYNVHGDVDPATLPSADYARDERASWKVSDSLDRAISDVREGRQSKEGALHLLQDNIKRNLLSEEECRRNVERAAAARQQAIEAKAAIVAARPVEPQFTGHAAME